MKRLARHESLDLRLKLDPFGQREFLLRRCNRSLSSRKNHCKKGIYVM